MARICREHDREMQQVYGQWECPECTREVHFANISWGKR